MVRSTKGSSPTLRLIFGACVQLKRGISSSDSDSDSKSSLCQNLGACAPVMRGMSSSDSDSNFKTSLAPNLGAESAAADGGGRRDGLHQAQTPWL